MIENTSNPTLILSFMREFPIESDIRYEDWRNPAIYTKETGIAIQGGELLVKATVLDEKGQNLEHFPKCLPITLLAQAALRDKPILKLHDKTFNFTVRISGFEEEPEKDLFELFVGFLIKKYIVYPDQPEPLPKHLKCLKDYRVEEAKINGNEKLASLYEEIYEEGRKEWDVLDHEEMSNQFLYRRLIKKGGQGTVFEVERASTAGIKALKITHAFLHPFLLPCIKAIVNHGLTPHLTPVENFFKVPGNQSPFDVQQHFREHQCYVMEKLTGEFPDIPQDSDDSDPALQEDIYEVQLASTLHLLKKLRVGVVDYKGRNILYKKLDDTDLYRGERLIDFDFWKYKVESYAFYVPRPKFLIKLVDYDSWTIEMFNLNSKTSYLKWDQFLSKGLEKLAVLFCKPDVEESKIIEIC